MVRERYEDFAPTLAWEKLTEVHGYGVSVETLRKWMVAEGLWRSKRRPGARVHQSRPRRPALGELVQIDGSPHAWFEDRRQRCTLIVFIDDATSRLMALRFAEGMSEFLCKGRRGHCAFQVQRGVAGKRSSNRIANCPMAAIQSIGRRQ